MHTQSGGRVTLTNLRLSDQFTPLGTQARRASELVVGSAAASTVPSAAAPGSGASVKSVDEMLHAIPATIEIMAGADPNLPGVEAANAWLAAHYVDGAIAMSMTLESTQVMRDDGYGYQANGRPHGILFHGHTIPSQVTALFRAAMAVPLGRVQHGMDFNVRGTLRRAEFVGHGRTLSFLLTVGEAQVKDPIVGMTNNLLPAGVQAAATPKPAA